MTENEALDMLRAKLKCMELELLACIGKGCDRKCDNCDCNYAQGNMGEQKEALSVAIQALEKQIPKKPIFTDDKQFALCPCCDMKGLADKQEYCDNCGQAIDWSDTD